MSLLSVSRRGVSRAQIDALNAANDVEIVMENPFVKNQFLLRVTDALPIDGLEMANRYDEEPLTDYAYPNLIAVSFDQDHAPPNDPLFGNQWHHTNTGQSGGTIDADSDTGAAWHLTTGNAATVIAVLENGGYDMSHPDLMPNFWVNAAEMPSNGVDDDLNGFVDDINGWDFVGCVSPATAGCGDNNPSPASATTEDHGTAVAGVAAARGNNMLGVTGACPNCSMMLLRTGYASSDWAKSLAFGYAQQQGARIITNSWSAVGALPNTDAAITTATGAGVVVLFASGNTNGNNCGDPRVSMPGVIAVSSSSNQDRKVIFSSIGNCIDILAPSHRGYTAGDPYTGTLNITTTDRTGAAGYNNTNLVTNCPTTEASPPPANARDYTSCFGGTSSATPLTAGIVGLIFSMNPTLTRIQTQRLLQDTTDKIEDSVGAYSTATGFSSPATGTATHSWGRVNAAEAVRIATPVAQGGTGGVDVFLRDNRLDWGNTEQPSNTLFEATRGYIGHWRSEDIKVDAPPYQPAPTTGATFESFVDETPSAIAGEMNRVYVRVRNRGPVTASSVNVKLHWTQFGTALPSLPPDFWTAFPANSTDTTQWRPLNCAGTASSVCNISNLAYSGSSVANTAADGAQIVSFDFPAPAIDPSLANHFCLTAMIESSQDPISPASKSMFVVDNITPTDNNVTHRNYHNLSDSNGRDSARAFLIRNPFDTTIESVLRLEAPDNWFVRLDKLGFGDVFTLAPQEEVLVTVVEVERGDQDGEFTIFQDRIEPRRTTVMGGVTFQFITPADRIEMFGTTLPGGRIDHSLLQLDSTNGAQSLIGAAGESVGAQSIDWNPVTGTLFGVDPSESPGVISEIDPKTGIASPVAKVAEPITNVSFSPDGKMWGSVDDVSIGTINLDSQEFTPLFDTPGGEFVLGMEISNDGMLYVAHSTLEAGAKQTLTLIDVATGRTTSQVAIGDLNIDDIDLASDGFIYHTNFSFALIRLDPATGQQTVVGFGDLSALGGIASASPVVDPRRDVNQIAAAVGAVAPRFALTPGDADRDGHFSNADLVTVFQSGKYETAERAFWEEGDWNGDGLFDSADLIAAFQSGQFIETGDLLEDILPPLPDAGF